MKLFAIVALGALMALPAAAEEIGTITLRSTTGASFDQVSFAGEIKSVEPLDDGTVLVKLTHAALGVTVRQRGSASGLARVAATASSVRVKLAPPEHRTEGQITTHVSCEGRDGKRLPPPCEEGDVTGSITSGDNSATFLIVETGD